MYYTILKILFLSLLLSIFTSYGAAGNGKPGDPDNPSDTLEESKGFMALPLFYYTPDTRFAFGALGVTYFRLKGQEGTTRLSHAKLMSNYTLNNQLDVYGSWDIFLPDEKYYIKGVLRYRNFPDRFYGVGNMSEPVYENFDYSYFTFKKLVMRKVRPNLFLGGDFHFNYAYGFDLEQDKLLSTGRISGHDGGLTSGLGLVGIYDSRDNVVYPSKGVFFEASSYFYGGYLGSDFNYTNLNLVFSTYKKVFNRGVLAANVTGNFNHGDIPFTSMAFAGSDEILRGYSKNRYRDNNFLGTQVEYRMPVIGRFGIACFAGIGDVFENISDVGLNTLKYSYGGGIRYTINEKEHLNIRLDYGIGRGGNNGFYIMVSEAF
ncbi:BamA/TamA family outer membrane protein [Cytophagaceae bacterium ABcell3]|nr:BamA/TamA family outer membrane protein [Cytophagaceae bacterium ABcell3]